MKTPEIPDAIFRKAKAKAAEQGISLRQFAIAAAEQRFQASPPHSAEPLDRA
jgi:hypothetical protein